MEKIEKLELKHLCGYLPHGLKCMTRLHKGNGQNWGALLVYGITSEHALFYPEHDEECAELFEYIKPLLLPLSALDTQTLINDLHGNMSDAILDWIDYFNSDCANKDKAILCAPYPVIEWCFENHIDIYGLIPAGLAIDKRTVKI